MMKKLALFLLSTATLYASSTSQPYVVYKATSLITEHWYRKANLNHDLPHDLLGEIGKLTTYPYCSPQPMITLNFPKEKKITLIDIVSYQDNAYILLSFPCHKNTKRHIQVVSLQNLASHNLFTSQVCNCETSPPYHIGDLQVLPKQMHKSFIIEDDDYYLLNLCYDSVNDHLIIPKYKEEIIDVIGQDKQAIQTLSGKMMHLYYCIWNSKILLNPIDQSMLLILREWHGGKNEILHYTYNHKHNQYNEPPSSLPPTSFHICKDKKSRQYNLSRTVVFDPEQNTLYSHYIEDSHGQHIPSITHDKESKKIDYKEYIYAIDVSNPKQIKKIRIKNNKQYILCKLIPSKNKLGLLFLSPHQDKTLGYLTMLPTNKQPKCIDTSNMIKIDFLHYHNTPSSVYKSLAIEHSTALSVDNQHLIHLYKDKHAHRMVHFSTTTGKTIGSWTLTDNNIGSASLIYTPLDFLILMTNTYYIRRHYF